MTQHSPDKEGIASAINETDADGYWEEKVDWWAESIQFTAEDILLIAVARVARENPSLFGQHNLDIINAKLQELRMQVHTSPGEHHD